MNISIPRVSVPRWVARTILIRRWIFITSFPPKGKKGNVCHETLFPDSETFENLLSIIRSNETTIDVSIPWSKIKMVGKKGILVDIECLVSFKNFQFFLSRGNYTFFFKISINGIELKIRSYLKIIKWIFQIFFNNLFNRNFSN